jgi:hypothetical protein
MIYEPPAYVYMILRLQILALVYKTNALQISEDKAEFHFVTNQGY